MVRRERPPVEFVGNLFHEEVFKLYTKTILIFLSFIEAFGLPLLQANLHKSIIFAFNCPFSREILNGYADAYYFDPFNSYELFELFLKAIEGNLKSYKDPHNGMILEDIKNS